MSINDLTSFVNCFSEYTELRLQENRDIRIAMIKGNLTANSNNCQGGISSRVYKGGSWGFSSSPQTGAQAIRSVIKSATENAIFLAGREGKSTSNLPITIANASNSFSTNKARKSQRELITFVKEVDNYIEQKYPSLTSRTLFLNSLEMEKNLLTSDGSQAFSMIPRTIFYVALSAIDKDGAPQELYNILGGLGQFEDVFNSPEEIFPTIDVFYHHLMKKREGIFASAGQHDCVLDSDLAGILAHEAIGHTTEADLVLGGSVAADYLQQQVASPLVTLIDFAHSALNKTCPVPVYVDDEGTKAQDVVIIERGILQGYMHNKESAQHFATAPTGNARAYEFSDEPLIRMRNTGIMPGSSKLGQMLESIENGYYLLKSSNGQADSTSEFMFGIPLGYEVKNGKIGRAIKDTTISGVAFEVLKTVTMISDDMTWNCGGMCGKKQMIPVGMGGPAIKCKVNIGGR